MDARLQPPMEIRDPIHGAITLDARESAVVDHPFVQRLRGIRQLGFSHLPFPGATHSRYAHSLGAMHLAGRAFDACFRDDPFSSPERRAAFRHCLRLAALCHDLGHPPFSHAAEFAMPPLGDLAIGAYAPGRVSDRLAKRACHEDYTVAILVGTALADTIRSRFPFGAQHVAALISPDVVVPDDFFWDRGFDLRGMLSQMISSDLDVDRLDYLVRDSYYTGARYGEVDVHWLLSNLGRHVDDDGAVNLALDQRALYAFDDFLVARFHMFVMVYFHQKSIAYEELLRRCLLEPGCAYRLPSDLDAYRHADDVHLLAWLREAPGQWARRIVELRPYKVAVEVHGSPGEIDLDPHRRALLGAGLDVMEASATGAVFGPRKPGQPGIHVIERTAGGRERVRPLDEVASIFQRYHDERSIGRLYVSEPDHAREILREAGL